MAASTLTRVPVVRNHKYKPHGLKSYVYMINKYSIRPTKPGPFHREGADKPLMRRLADGTAGSVTADDQQNDSFYTCAVEIGTPPQTVNLNFDSGSSDLWVKSTELPKTMTKHKKGISFFDPTKSTTFRGTKGATWEIQYGDGSGASGDVGTDILRIGGISVEGQAIECATKMSEQFSDEASSGLLGLAWGSINTVKPTPAKTPVENMIAQNGIPSDKKLFSVCLGSVKEQADPDASQSFYTFGAIDEELIERSGQKVSWTPIDNSQGFWMYESSSMTVQGNSIRTPGNKAIMDTGTTLSLVDDRILDQIYRRIPGAEYDQRQQGWLIPTGYVNLRPEITFAIGSKHFTIKKEHLAWAPVTDTMSYGAIQSRGNLPFDIMGDTMLMCIYCIFDVGNKRIGCVERPDPTPAGQ